MAYCVQDKARQLAAREAKAAEKAQRVAENKALQAAAEEKRKEMEFAKAEAKRKKVGASLAAYD